MIDALSALWLSVGLGALFALVVIYALWRLLLSRMVKRQPADEPQLLASTERQAQTALGRLWELLNRPIWRPRQ